MTVKELRRYQRFEHRAKIQVHTSTETVVAYTKNLSDKGLFITGLFTSEIGLGEILEITVMGIESPVTRPVVVKRIEPGIGIAVEFSRV